MKRLWFCCVGICISFCSSGQQETANWLFQSGFKISFQDHGPSFDSTYRDSTNLVDLPLATISDKDGNLLFFVDSENIRDGNGQVIENGNLNNYYSIIVNRPGFDNMYYVFSLQRYDTSWRGGTGNKMAYSIVDLDANSGNGKVILKNKTLYKDLHGSFAIAGKQGGPLWFVGEANRNNYDDTNPYGTDSIFVYKIDSSGISFKTAYAPPYDFIGNSSDIRLSPQGDKVAFSYYNTYPNYSSNKTHEFTYGEIFVEGDFNLKTGEISKLEQIGTGRGPMEFSPDGSKIYFINTIKQQEISLYQYDIQTNESLLIKKDGFDDIRLAPDCRIYLGFNDRLGVLGVIENPNETGPSCLYFPDGLTLPVSINLLPKFASFSIAYDFNTSVSAGRDTVICSGQKIRIGDLGNNDTYYTWLPTTYLNDIHSPTPEFNYTPDVKSIVSLTYLVTGFKKGCPKSEVVNISVKPSPATTINGAKSVCPGVDGIEYRSITMDSVVSYHWTIAGGVLSSINGMDSVSVDWGKTSDSSSVMLNVSNKFGCSTNFKLPVRVNPVLQTETPTGLDSICSNLLNSYNYKIDKINGSEFDWSALNGLINQGQKSNQVTVNWQENYPHLLWVQEKSVTMDTVCYGTSDTLRITVFHDPAKFILNNVTLDMNDERTVHIETAFEGKAFILSGSLYRKAQEETQWSKVEDVDLQSINYNDFGLQSDHEIYQYQIMGESRCYSKLESLIHNTILLKGSIDEQTNLISINWNSYINWSQGVLRYEILRRVDKQDAYHIFDTTFGDQTYYLSNSGLDGFNHHFKIRAISSDGIHSSLSNEINFEFKHEIFVPNIITPNGDHLNDTFEIRNIVAYKDNELIIINRYGREVFHADNYLGGWDGGELSSGIYYVFLRIPGQPIYNDWLQIVR